MCPAKRLRFSRFELRFLREPLGVRLLFRGMSLSGVLPRFGFLVPFGVRLPLFFRRLLPLLGVGAAGGSSVCKSLQRSPSWHLPLSQCGHWTLDLLGVATRLRALREPWLPLLPFEEGLLERWEPFEDLELALLDLLDFERVDRDLADSRVADRPRLSPCL